MSNTLKKKLRNRARNFRFNKRKITTEVIRSFLQPYATDRRILIVHSEDFDTEKLFPNAVKVSAKASAEPDFLADDEYQNLRTLPLGCYDMVVCTGLLEHVKSPSDLISDLKSLLNDDGLLLLAASSVFPVHEHPRNFFMFTEEGLKLLFDGWGEVEYCRGSCGTLFSVAVLFQRILLQTECNLVFRLFIEALCVLFIYLDKVVRLKEYGVTWSRSDQFVVESIMPTNIHCAVRK